jgi:hypothetical protein
MHDISTLQHNINSHQHSSFHASDYMAIILSFIPTLFTFLNNNSGVFVSLAALFGASFTIYRWCTVYLDRRKVQNLEKELKGIVHKSIHGEK